MSTQQPHLYVGIVKQVVSGDTVIIRGQPRGGPPKEKTLGLSNVVAPKLARYQQKEKKETPDEPYAWEAREFLRKKLVGKEVCFVLDKKDSKDSKDGEKKNEKPQDQNKKEYGTIYIGRDMSGENVTESLIAEGLVDVRRNAVRSNEAHQRLCELEDNAKASGKGKHGPDASSHVRSVKWEINNDKRNFMDALHQKPVKAIIEHVRDGSTLRVILLPDYYYITLMLSGIRCPTIRMGDSSEPVCEPFAEEAKFFTECRLLQRDVEVILESVSSSNFLGTVIHPNGNIAELLLAEGFAKCIDWSLQCVTCGPEKLRAAERQAKEKRLRIWKDYTPSGPVISAKEKEFQGKVVEVFNADTLMIKMADSTVKKIFLASVRPPRMPDEKQDKLRGRALYDIPHMFEAREFLRKKLIGKKVNVTVDYIQPAKKDFEKEYPEKVCCTVTIGGVNVAEALVSKGLATVVRYRADDDQRSAHYDELLAAETKAQKSGKGLHGKKDTPPHRIVDLSGDLAKSKQFLPFLQRAGRMEAIVEFVASGSRLRLYVPRENCLLTFLLAGITCAKAGRTDPRYNERIEGDPWGDEALAFTKDLCMQREVEVEVEAMDKAGNFIGWLWMETVNLSVALVREGYAEVHISAERSPHYRALQQAETEAKNRKAKMWENHVPVDFEPKEEPIRKYDPKRVEITEIRSDLMFYAQLHDEGPKLVELLQQLRHDLATNVPLPGSYIPKKNDICASLFSEDGMWYRAKVEKIVGKAVHVMYIDYGNREITTASRLAALPATYQSLPPAAREYGLAFVHVPRDPESAEDARQMFQELTTGTSLFLNVEYKSGSIPYASLMNTGSDEKKRDLAKDLVENGYLIVEKRKELKFRKVINEYLAAQESAKNQRLNLWRYGDITEDDAKEFG